MRDIDLIDDSFSLKSTDTYHLSIQTSLSGLSFTIMDLNKLRYIVLRHYPFEGLENPDETNNYLSSIYKEDNLLKLKYKSINHVFVGNRSTLIPQSDFDEKNSANYLQFLFKSTDKQVALFNTIPAIQCNNVYCFPKLLFSNINQLFTKINLYHHSTSFINYLISGSSKLNVPLCHIFLSDGFINIGIAKDSKLLFFNAFDIKEKSDIAYFVLSVLEQFNMSALSSPVHFSSDTKNHDEIFDFINNFLGQIHFIQPSDKFTYSVLFDELHLTRFANLFNLSLCE